MFKTDENNFIKDCYSNNEVIKIPKSIKGISEFSFMGLDTRVISFEGDCQIEENSFVELANLEVLDCRGFSDYLLLGNIESCLLNCPLDVCIIVKDDDMRQRLAGYVRNFLIFTDLEFYEDGLKDEWAFGNLFLYDEIVVDEEKVLVMDMQYAFVEDELEKLKESNVRGFYVPDHLGGKQVVVNGDGIFAMISRAIPTIKYVKFPKLLFNEYDSDGFGNMSLCEFERVHLSRKGDAIPKEFLTRNDIENLYIPSNYNYIAGFEHCNLRNIVFEDFSSVERVDFLFAIDSPYMDREEIEAKKKNREIFIWKDVALRIFEKAPSREFVIPNGVRIVANNFLGGNRLDFSKLIFGKDVTFVGDYAFANQLNLKEISFSPAIKKIFYASFEDNRCKVLDIPDTIEYIGGRAFFVTPKLWLDEGEDFPRTINCPMTISMGEDAFGVEQELLPFN